MLYNSRREKKKRKEKIICPTCKGDKVMYRPMKVILCTCRECGGSGFIHVSNPISPTRGRPKK